MPGSCTLDKKKQANECNKQWLEGREHWLKCLPKESFAVFAVSTAIVPLGLAFRTQYHAV